MAKEFEYPSDRRVVPAWIFAGIAILLVFCLCGMAIFGIRYFFEGEFAGSQSEPRFEDPVSVFETATHVSIIPTAAESLAVVTNLPLPTLTVTPTATENLRKAQISEQVYYVALRRSPGYKTKNDDYDILAEIPAGQNVVILDGPEIVDELSWWFVSWRGHQGWVAEKTGSGKIILIFDP